MKQKFILISPKRTNQMVFNVLACAELYKTIYSGSIYEIVEDELIAVV